MLSISQARKYFISAETIKRKTPKTVKDNNNTTTTRCINLRVRAFAECKRCLIKIDNLFSTPINFIPFINFLRSIDDFLANEMRQNEAIRAQMSNEQQWARVSLCHRISCLTKIYLLDITSRNKEVDLNYRSVFLCDKQKRNVLFGCGFRWN